VLPARRSSLLLLAVLAGSPSAAAPVEEKMAAMGVPRVALLAHRGVAWDAPEETLPSFLLAGLLGADYLEMDLHLTKDGVVVLNHDDTFERTTDVARKFPGREKRLVGDFTWEEVSRLDAGESYNDAGSFWTLRRRFPRAAFQGAKVLRLEELPAIARAWPGLEPGLYVEAKYPDEHPDYAVKVAEGIVSVLRGAGWIKGQPDDGRRVIFESFSADAVKRFKSLAPTVPATFLYDAVYTTGQEDAAIRQALDCGADIIGPNLLPWRYRGFIARAHAKGLAVHPWTIDDKIILGRFRVVSGRRLMRLMTRGGVDGFFTNQVYLGEGLSGRAPAVYPRTPGGIPDWPRVWELVDAKMKERAF